MKKRKIEKRQKMKKEEKSNLRFNVFQRENMCFSGEKKLKKIKMRNN